jgi:hypothetical protein
MKKIFNLVFIAGLGYLFYKIYKLLKDAIELEKFLPKFFESHLGEKPEISLKITLNQILLTAKFTKSTLEKNPDLKKSIIDYVTNYYSGFCMKRFQVELLEKADEPKPEIKPEKTVKEETVEEVNKVEKKTPRQTPKKKPSSTRNYSRKPRKKKTENL